MTSTDRRTAAVLAIASVRAACTNGRCAQVRTAAGLSQRDLAGAVGVHAATLSRWEGGTRAPHGQAAIRLAAVLDALEQLP